VRAPIVRHPMVEIALTTQELAEQFCSMKDAEQAEFFSHIGEIVATWTAGAGSFAMQLQYLIDSGKLTPRGRSIMCQIGEYGEARK